MCLGLGVYFRAPEPGVYLFFLGTACYLGAFPLADFFGTPPAASRGLSVVLSSWMVSVKIVAAPAVAPEVGLIIGLSSPSNGFRLTNRGPVSTSEVFRGSSDCFALDGSGWTSTVAAVTSSALTAVAAGGFLLRSAWVFLSGILCSSLLSQASSLAASSFAFFFSHAFSFLWAFSSSALLCLSSSVILLTPFLSFMSFLSFFLLFLTSSTS